MLPSTYSSRGGMHLIEAWVTVSGWVRTVPSAGLCSQFIALVEAVSAQEEGAGDHKPTTFTHVSNAQQLKNIGKE